MIRYLILFILVACGAENRRAREAWGCMADGVSCRDNRSPGPSDSPSPSATPAQCTVREMSQGAEVKCEEGKSVIILNGKNGSDGKDGKDAPPSPYQISEIINPCDETRQYHEVLLRTTGGKLLAHYSDGTKQFMTEIGPGSYVTTDGYACRFSVDAQMRVTW